MWYVDDTRPLTDRRNWTPEKMNELLERKALCNYGKCFCNVIEEVTAMLFIDEYL